MNYWEYIEENPSICGGRPVVKGTRVPIRTILSSLAAGDSPETILADFPGVSPEALSAVIAFAAASASEDLPLAPLAT